MSSTALAYALALLLIAGCGGNSTNEEAFQSLPRFKFWTTQRIWEGKLPSPSSGTTVS